MIIIILGSPGSGKGTQAELISGSFNLRYFETSKLLEDRFQNASVDDFIEVDGQKFYSKKEKENWSNGLLVSPPFVTQLVISEIHNLYQQKKEICFSGSPRTLYEGERVIPLLKELYGVAQIKVIFLEVTQEETIYRNSNRRLCELVRHPILYSEETKNLNFCPIDGSRLLKREGLDDPETIKVRIKEFEKRTLPLLAFMEKEGLSVIKINGSQPPAVVFAEIRKVIMTAQATETDNK